MTPEEFANRVYIDGVTYGKSDKTIEVFIDPATAIMLTQLTIKIIACIVERRRQKISEESEAVMEVAAIINDPSFLDKLTLRKMIFGAIGFRRYRKEGKSILESLLRTASGLTLGEIADLFYGAQS